MNIIIEASGVGKKYLLGHRRGAGYATFRESVSGAVRDWGRRLIPYSRTGAGADVTEEFWALRDVSFEVAEGDRLGIIGRNGAGKSTLLKILSRITEPTTGRVRLRGRVGSLLEVGTGFHPELTGRENIFLNGAVLGMGKSEMKGKFDEIVEFAEIARFLDTPVKRYSSGMYVRLAFAVAAHLEPEILLVDEVLAVGDAQFQKKCLGKMRNVGRDGRTVLFVSHNMSAIGQLCNRAVLLEGGRIKTAGDTASVVEAYLSGGAGNERNVDLSGFRSAYGNREIDVLSIELLNGVGGRFAVRWDEPAVLSLRYRSNKPLANVSFAIGCQTADMIPMFTVRSSDPPGRETPLAEGAAGAVTARIRHNLRAGLYNIVVGVSSGNYVYYYHPDAAQMEVLDQGADGEYPYRNTGLVHCAAEWEHSCP